MAPPAADLPPELGNGPVEYSGTGSLLEAGAAPRVRNGGVAPLPPCGGAPGGLGGIPLSAATGFCPDEETETPAPGEIWLDALSRLPPVPRPISMSLSSETISLAFA